MIVFLLKRRISNFFCKDNLKSIIWLSFMCLTMLIYGIGVAQFYDHFLLNNKKTARILIVSVEILVLITPIILKFFPSVTLKKCIVGANYPVSSLKMACVDFFAVCLTTTTYWVLFIFVSALIGFSDKVSYFDSSLLVYCWFLGFLFAENLINALSWAKYVYLSVVTGSLIMLLVLLSYCDNIIFVNKQCGVYVIVNTLLIGLLCMFFMLYERKIPLESNSNQQSERRSINPFFKRNLTLRIIFNNSNIRVVLLIAFLIKVIFLLFFIVNLKQHEIGYILLKAPFFLLLVLPIIPFTYVYNNLWGYLFPVELNNIVSGNTFKGHLRIYLAFLIPIILMDFTCVLVVFIIFGMLSLKLFLIYIVFVIYSSVMGLISSFRKYSSSDVALSFSNFRVKTSKVYACFNIIPGLLIGMCYQNNNLVFIILVAMLVVSAMLYKYMKGSYVHHLNILKHSMLSVK
ncbi:hypothetical protein H9X96_20615 [Pedobacter sp. N36a]|uniref:hypothetical protein n=1 Tax=Pedobacter sp. N36a TaxID=2767996 RepID=UPI001656CAA3|nr:hypothetical protein [Pedobacter sp. N36a]MBC8988164.1 hypothetical protein [Pedobacter sp. N36a]